MNNKVGRNEPCPCGSGKKYKNCCYLIQKKPTIKKKFTAKLLSTPAPVNLIERTFGPAIEAAGKIEKQGEGFQDLQKESSPENSQVE
jgi:uncharacterized protein